MPATGKILNTNMGLGFQRGRKYDTDMDRLGRIDTAQGELRKGLRGFNFQKELKKESMRKTYSVKRFSAVRQKEYGLLSGVGEGVKQTVGNVTESAGKLTDSFVGRTAGTIGGMMAGAALGPLGMIGGAITGNIGSKAIGKGLKAAGQEMKNSDGFL